MPGLLFGGAVISDIRTTLIDRQGHQRPFPVGVQKVHALVPNSVVAFSGEVDVALYLIEEGRTQMLRDWPGPGWSLPPGILAERWSRRLPRVWHRQFGETKKLPVELLVMGSSGRERRDPFQRTRGFVLRSPRFLPEEIPAQTALAIGSGSAVTGYQEALARVMDPNSSDFWSVVNVGETGGQVGGSLPIWAFLLDTEVAKARDQTVSEHLHLCLVRDDGVTIQQNDLERPDGSGPPRRMPAVVTSLSAWRDECRRSGVAAGQSAIG